MSHIEVIARAVIHREGYVLVSQKVGADNTYLPGGHIEVGEPAKAALAREFREELGLSLEIQRFLGAVEHAYGDMKDRTHEINLLFECTAPGLDIATAPDSNEPELAFHWVRVDELPESKLEPYVLRDQLAAWVFSQAPGRFAGTMA